MWNEIQIMVGKRKQAVFGTIKSILNKIDKTVKIDKKYMTWHLNKVIIIIIIIIIVIIIIIIVIIIIIIVIIIIIITV